MSSKLHLSFADTLTNTGKINAARLVSATDRVDLPFDDTLKIGSGSFVIALWYQPSVLTIGTHVVAQYGTNYTDGFLFNQLGADLAFYLQTGGPLFTASGVFDLNVMSRIVVVGDSGAQTVKLYVDNVLRAQASSVTWNITVNTQTRLGASPDLPIAALGLYYDYIVCKASVGGFSIPDASAIQSDYTGFSSFTGISARFPLNEGTGTTVSPSVGAPPNGTITGGTLGNFDHAYTAHMVNTGFTIPTDSVVAYNLRILLRDTTHTTDGYSLAALATGIAKNVSDTLSFVGTITGLSVQSQGPPDDSRANMFLSTTALYCTLRGVAGVAMDWEVFLDYWVL